MGENIVIYQCDCGSASWINKSKPKIKLFIFRIKHMSHCLCCFVKLLRKIAPFFLFCKQTRTTHVPSMIPSARSTVPLVAITIFTRFCFVRFEKCGRTDGRTCVKIVITTNRDRGSAEWIKRDLVPLPHYNNPFFRLL